MKRSPVKMPQLSDTMTDGVLVSWEKNIGDKVNRGDIVATVETDKAVMDVEVFKEGYLAGPFVTVGNTVEVNDPIAFLVDSLDNDNANDDNDNDDDIEDIETGRSSVEIKSNENTLDETETPDILSLKRPVNKKATPYVRHLAAKKGIDLNTIAGSGPDGAITAVDLNNMNDIETPNIVVTQTEIEMKNKPDRTERPMSVMEQAVCRSMTASLSMPLFHVTVKVKPDSLTINAKEKKVSLTVAIAKAAALAITKHPRLNWCYMPDEKIAEHKAIDIGIAVVTDDGGLVVPVLRDCGTNTLEQLDLAWKEIVPRARKRRLDKFEYTNATFMISNMGMLGVTSFDAIPMPGMAAAMAISAIGDDGGMPVTISADHRVVNGAEVALFLKSFKSILETDE